MAFSKIIQEFNKKETMLQAEKKAKCKNPQKSEEDRPRMIE